MKRSLITLFLFLLLTTFTQAADRSILNFPILFAKQFNYQGIHIYDTFYQWRPGGGIYVLENPADPPEQHRVRAVIDPTTPETLGEGVYFDPSLSWCATKIVFSFKGTPDGNSVIYEIGVDGTGLRQITNLDNFGNPYLGVGGGHHDVKPSYLADGRIVFTSTRYSGLVPCANNGVAILHVVDADGSNIRTISVNNVTEFDPVQLADGRILYGRWEYIDKNALTIQSLWTVLPDGTNETALFANNVVFPEAILQARPVPGEEHLIVATFAPHNAPPRGSIAIIDTRVCKNGPEAIFNFEHHDRPTHDRGDSQYPWPLSRDVVLFSGIPPGNDAPRLPDDIARTQGRNTPVLNALMLIDRTGARTVVHSNPYIDLHNPIPLVPRPKPQLLADSTDRSQITGNFFIQDVYDGMPTVPRGSVRWLRLIEETSRVSESPGSNPFNQTFSASAALAWGPKIYLGIVPVEEDGSVYFEAPSGRALYFQLLDEDYRLVRSMRTFIQAVPGTTRSCVGCHEDKFSAAPAASQFRRIPIRPLVPIDESWGSGYLDYPSMIQPIFDRRCVECHGGAENINGGFAGGLDLSGGWTEWFNISYENLTARRERQYIADLISGICCMNGTAYWSVQIFEPYAHGSGNARLAEVLLTEPHRTHANLTQTERELIFAWIDSNGLYFGTWDFTRAGPRATEYARARDLLIAEMRRSSCVDCHFDASGNIRRFDDWINLEHPTRSRILRAPLAKNAGGEALCRERPFNQSFSRLGLIFQSGYEHSVRELHEFPTQHWVPWEQSLEGTPVVTFASTSDPTYQRMLAIIEEARTRQLLNPRVDMPFANEIGAGIIAGRSRQIIPQPLPETLPEIHASVDDDGIVRLRWERSHRTIGLIAEIYRHQVFCGIRLDSDDFYFGSTEGLDLIGRTELAEFTDKNAPLGLVFYVIVFVSDPAETSGTTRGGAVLMCAPPHADRVNFRCPLSTAEPQRSKPVWTSVVVPPPQPPPAPQNLRAASRPGAVRLYWDETRPGQYRYNVYIGERKLNAEPVFARSFSIGTNVLEDVEYTVETVSRIVGGRSTVTAQPLPVRTEPVFDLVLYKGATDAGRLVAPATFDDGELNLSNGGHFVVAPNEEFNVGEAFSVEFSVKFDERGNMPVIVSNGYWNQAGWFVQSIGGRWRFHVGGVDLDGGAPRIGEWMHIVGTYDGSTLRLYENGTFVAERPAVVSKNPWTQNFVIGQYSGPISPQFQVRGRIRDVRIWHQVLMGYGR